MPIARRNRGVWVLVYGVAFLSGAVLMGLEMIGSRILAPAFGSSIYIWGSLIGVVLMALTAGYYVGGRLSDGYPTVGPLSLVLAVAAVWIGLVPRFANNVLSLGASLSGAGGALFSALALFFVPSFLLAMVSPWCIRLSVSSLERAGSSCGAVSAVSNAGSIVGTFATSFLLIPRLGVDSIVRGMSVILAALSVFVAMASRNRRRAVFMSLLALVVSFALGGHRLARHDAGLVFEVESLYHRIYVEDRGRARFLRFDNSVQGGMYLDEPWESFYPYPDYFHLALCIKEDVRDVLVIGLGAGLAPKRFARDYPEAVVEVAELDDRVLDVARRYFGFPGQDEIPVYIKDGRMFLVDAAKCYDLIIVDAYHADSIPFHLATREFFELVRECLKPGGVVAYNMIGALVGSESKLFRSMYATFAGVFPENYVFPLGYGEGREAGYRNIEVFGVADLGRGADKTVVSPALWEERAEALAGTRVTVSGFISMAREIYAKPISTEGAVVLTDDYAPVDSLLHLY